MAATKTQFTALKKKLEEVEKAKALAEKTRDEAVKAKDATEQHGYEVGVAETEDSLKAEVSAMCRTYCALVWDEALNQGGVEVSTSVGTTPAVGTTSEGVEQAEDTSKAGEFNIEAVQGFDLPPPAPRDTSKEKETSQSMKLVLVTLTIPPKEDPKEKVEVSTTVANTQPPKDPNDKLVIKMKK